MYFDKAGEVVNDAYIKLTEAKELVPHGEWLKGLLNLQFTPEHGQQTDENLPEVLSYTLLP